MVARRNWTRRWWDTSRENYRIATGTAVIEELGVGAHPAKSLCLEMMACVPILPVSDRIAEIVAMYIKHHVMPRNPVGDALHLALASAHGCHFLLTWNCAHLANANKQEHIRHVNAMLGLPMPVLTTPLELLTIKEESL